MKKVCIMTLILVMTMSLSACRRNENTKPTETIPPATEQTVPVTKPTVPAIDPTLDTNIPDPSVDSNSDMTDNFTDSTQDNVLRDKNNEISKSRIK